MNIGDIHRRLYRRSVVYRWSIPNFFSLMDKEMTYSSPEFQFLKKSWKMILCTKFHTDGQRPAHLKKGKKKKEKNVGNRTGISLWRKPGSPPKSVYYTFGLGIDEGISVKTITSYAVFPENSATSGMREFVENSELLRIRWDLADPSCLTVICTMWEHGPFTAEEIDRFILSPSSSTSTDLPTNERFVSRETKTDDLEDGGAREENLTHIDRNGEAIQQKHFKDMLLLGEDYDVTLRVKGREFSAHKNILRARSPVFAAMFTHGVKEAESGDVTIEDCDPSAFNEFLEYVYVGSVQIRTPSKALGLYYAGDKYGFPDLKEICVEFLKASMSINVICEVITMAMKHNEDELLTCAMAFFSKHLVDILMTVEWQRFLKCNSTLANELNIKAMKTSYRRIE